ncbi:MAG: DUF4931 domain-containing protein [Peptococcaceae bacterium]|nr:DUF4931 domain-containing protein [Peptococcaceae bacterium]
MANQALETQLIFQTAIGNQKPHTMRGISDSACPFCDRNLLPPIIKEDGDILLIPNKYPILRGSSPLVLIETKDCDSELSLYPEDRLLRVFRMALDTWEEMMADPQYASVLFLKNHGPFSGGSLRHPHMQIIGLADVDYRLNVREENFLGPVIYRDDAVELNISARPLVGFTEFNGILRDKKGLRDFCLLIQQAVRFVLRYLQGGRFNSYNLFFYRLAGVSYCKIVPRGVTTPLFIGYSIPQVGDNLPALVKDFQTRFFSDQSQIKIRGDL